MAFTNESVSSIGDLVGKLDTFFGTAGWTPEHLDVTTTAGTGGEWAMRRTNAVNLRFAASWDAENSGTNLALYQYVDQNYVISDRPWGQDNDSGNGFTATTPDSSILTERHVIIGSDPIQYWAFEDDDYTYVSVETSPGIWTHFGFGVPDKHEDDWVGGPFCFGQRNNLTAFSVAEGTWDGMSYLLDGHTNDTTDAGGFTNGMELIAATVHVEGFPNQPANGKWGVSMGGTAGSPQTDFGFDRQSNDGASSDIARVLFTWGYRGGIFVQGPQRFDGTDVNGHIAMWDIASTYVDTTTGDIHGYPLFIMKGVFGISMNNYTGNDTIVTGGDTYRIFPAQRRWPDSGTGIGFSSWLGIAYKEVP